MLDHKYGGLKIVFITLKKRKKNKKNEKKSNSNNKFLFTFFFLYRKIYTHFVRKHIWKNYYIFITVFWCDRLLEVQ